MSIVHQDDSYGRLVALCAREGYALCIATLKKGMELRVESNGERLSKGARISTPFQPGHENTAASYLLGKLRAAA